MNIRSLRKNIGNLTSLLKCFRKSPHISLSETCLKESIKHLYNLDGYEAYLSCRTEREHGGVSLYISSDLHAELIQQFTFANDDVEMCTIKLKTSTNFLFSAIYTPHGKHIA